MADSVNNLATLNGLFKRVYADKLLDLVPDFAVIQKRVEFSPSAKRLGDLYVQPVALSQEAGVTYLSNTETAGNAGQSLNDAVAATMKEAQVRGSGMVLRSQLGYLSLARAASEGEGAFKAASAWKIEDMNNTMRKRIELAILYGQSGLGKVSALNSSTITVTDATWAAGIWVGMEGALLEGFDSQAATANQDGATMTITAIDTDLKAITVSGTTTGVDSNTHLYFKGARTTTAHLEMAGLQAIISATTTIFNIDPSAFSLWKGTTNSTTGQLSHEVIQNVIAKAVNKGLMGKVVCLLSPKAFGVLNSDASALRVFDSSYSKSKGSNGFESLVFHSTNGQCEVVSHPFVKEGDAFIVPLDTMLRIGSVDLTFGVPGMDEEFFSLVPAKAAVEVQCMTDQAVFLEKPAHAIYMSGITYA